MAQVQVLAMAQALLARVLVMARVQVGVGVQALVLAPPPHLAKVPVQDQVLLQQVVPPPPSPSVMDHHSHSIQLHNLDHNTLSRTLVGTSHHYRSI